MTFVNDSPNADRRFRLEQLTSTFILCQKEAQKSSSKNGNPNALCSSDPTRRTRFNHTTCLTNPSGTRARAPTARALANGTFLYDGKYGCIGTPFGVHTWQEDSDWEEAFWMKGTPADGDFVQPRLHPPCRSHPQVRLEHLPSVLQGEERRHRIRQGTVYKVPTHHPTAQFTSRPHRHANAAIQTRERFEATY